MDSEKVESYDCFETAATDTTSDSSLLESPSSIPPKSSDSHRWMHHASGRMLPVGIAHPLKVDHTRGGMVATGDDPETEYDETFVKMEETGQNKHSSSSSSKLGEEEAANSDDNEEKDASSSVDSDASSSSSESEEEGEVHSQVAIKQQKVSEDRKTVKLQKVSEDKKMVERYPKSAGIVGKPPSIPSGHQPHSKSVAIPSALPPRKKFHLFVSHSTSDKDFVREAVIVPLRDNHGLEVLACYRCMPDANCFDDKAINKAMNESCVVMVAISAAYVNSHRCVKEWKSVVKLHHQKVCRVVIGAFGVVSRPEPLKSFTYLDFMDKTKRAPAMSKLLLEIDMSVKRLQPKQPLRTPSPQPHDEDKIPTPCKSDPLGLESSQSFMGRPTQQQSSRLCEEETEEEDDGYYRQMEEEFEADYPTQDEQEVTEGVEQHDAASSDSESSSCGEIEEGEERDYHESQDGGHVTADESQSLQRGQKRTREEVEEEEGEVNDDSDIKQSGNAAQVASFYNRLAEPNLESRRESRIFHLRNFNNWVKSVLIRMHILYRDHTVLDLCCGKGGDLLKWKEGNIEYLVGADIAATSIEQCETRYNSDKMRGRHRQPLFDAEFHTADCTRVRLRDVYKNPAMRFNVASCQFSLHYCFESAPQAEMMLQNLCENLRPGGFFIGTTVDSNELVCRFRSSTEDSHMCGNTIYSAVPSFNIDDIPLFGAKYDFHLEGVVDVPEYLIHFPLLVRMLKKHNMELVLKQDFHEFFYRRQQFCEDSDLLYRMQALDRQTGEISKEEWDVIGLYLVFAFRKC